MIAKFAACMCFLSSLASYEFQKISNAPEIWECEGFLTDAECDHFINLARPYLQRSTVVDPNSPNNKVDSRRTSEGTFLSSRMEDKLLKKVLKRIEKATEIPQKNGEDVQILHYGVGGEYRPHYDSFDPSTQGGLAHFNRGGQRIATFLIYLNTPEEGGETIFPNIRLSVAPRKGKAVLFYNVNSLGLPEPLSLHGGAPVIRGEKWLFSRWMREGAFHF